MGLRNKVIGGVAWTFAERFSAQLVSFVVSIILARLIAPDAFGVIALVLVFINILDTFAVAGFGTALIQKKNADSLDFSTVFHFSIFFSVFLYFCLFITAPLIAKFYNQSLVEIVIKVLGIRVFFAGVNSVQRAYVSRQMQFKRFFYSTFAGTLISAAIGISLATLGYGIWALVAQYLSNAVLGTAVLFLIIDWRPKLEFSFTRLKSLFSFGWKILGSNLLSTIYVELTDLVIGKLYTPASLAYYNRGKKFPHLFVSQIMSAIDTVLFPAMSKHQDDRVKLKWDIRYSIRVTSFIIFPLVFCMAMVAENLIIVLLTDKWIESVIYLQIACISYALLPISISNIQAIKALGRSDIYLKLDIIKKIIGVTLLFAFCKQGVIAIVIADAISNFVGLFVNVFPNKKLVNYSLKELLVDIYPTALLTIVMCIFIRVVDFIVLPPVIALLLQIAVGGGVYVLSSYISKNKTFFDIVSIAKSFAHRKNE